jgi:hypothetical protein
MHHHVFSSSLDLGLKVEEQIRADLWHRELQKIRALLLTIHGSRWASLLLGRRRSGFM